MKKKIYSALFGYSAHPFDALGEDVDVIRDPEELKELDSVLVVWGGADIDPAYYKHPMHSTTHPGGLRDRLEWGLMNEAKDRGIPIIGVCRGAQMLCALSGGFLLQDVRNHADADHAVRTVDNQTLMVNSMHHQMMCMTEMPEADYELVAWREGRKGYPYEYKDNKQFIPPDVWREPEFVYFPKTRGYAIQWHPEGMSSNSPATQYIFDFIKKKEKEYSDGYAVASL